MTAAKGRPSLVIRAGRRLAREQWGDGHAIHDADCPPEDREVEVTVRSLPHPPEWAVDAAELRGVPVVQRRRRYLCAGVAYCVAWSWIPLDLAEGTAIMDEDSGPGGIYARLAEIGHEPVQFVECVTAAPPGPAERRLLPLADGEHVLRIARLAMDGAGRKVEVCLRVYGERGVTLVYEVSA